MRNRCFRFRKSTLINEVLYKNINKTLNKSNEKVGSCKEVKGLHNIDKIINIDQSPIGRTPRSNPATYTSVFDFIREIFATTMRRKCVDMIKVDLALMFPEVDVKLAQVMELLK